MFRADRGVDSGKGKGDGLVVYAGTKYQIAYLDNMTKCTADIEIMWMVLDLPCQMAMWPEPWK